ncbi:hypothetical protein [Haloactinomyces albus]|uniref:Uncharacterized protein n=1 Tax=Haloactinomyces albus TaxID=1352928 RepID=A0AAE3ZEK6_9ACTN|nr:hypothetical protein [Haloactinomyces albus]MDR7301574.1 hypothetical protein [Haloactinomyces albus]
MAGPTTGRSRQRHVHRLLVLAVLALFSVVLSACGGDETGGPETSADVGDITGQQAYFGGSDQFVGQRVTLSAEVTEVFTPTSFQLDAAEWGDDSLLVVSAQQRNNLRAGELVQVTGTVRSSFAYDQNADRYGLAADAEVYSDYEGEKYLAASSVKQQVRTTQ